MLGSLCSELSFWQTWGIRSVRDIYCMAVFPQGLEGTLFFRFALNSCHNKVERTSEWCLIYPHSLYMAHCRFSVVQSQVYHKVLKEVIWACNIPIGCQEYFVEIKQPWVWWAFGWWLWYFTFSHAMISWCQLHIPISFVKVSHLCMVDRTAVRLNCCMHGLSPVSTCSVILAMSSNAVPLSWEWGLFMTSVFETWGFALFQCENFVVMEHNESQWPGNVFTVADHSL